jgi:hypothetical protein
MSTNGRSANVGFTGQLGRISRMGLGAAALDLASKMAAAHLPVGAASARSFRFRTLSSLSEWQARLGWRC